MCQWNREGYIDDMATSQDKLGGFLQWLQVNGVQLRGCKLRPCDLGGYGLYSETDDSGGILLVAPLRLAITPMAVLQDPSLGPEYGKLFEEGDVDDRFLMIVFLLVEHARENSFWSPYLDMLPSTFGTPLWFTEDEFSELKGTALYHATKLQLKNLKALFNERVKELAETLLSYVGMPCREIAFEDFLWANSIFWTRALNIPCSRSFVFPSQPPVQLESGCLQENHFKMSASKVATEDTSPPQSSSFSSTRDCAEMVSEQSSTVWVEGLVPGIDFCNHDPKGKALWEVDDVNGSVTGVPFSMYLIAGPNVAFSTEEEIRISYGNKGNEELLYLYGFVIENNPDDFIMVHYPKEALQRFDCAELKLQLLEEQKLQLRWLLPTPLLHKGFSSESSQSSVGRKNDWSQMSGYSWSGHRKVPSYMDHLIFPEDLMAALRTIAMQEHDMHGVISLLTELSESGYQRQPSEEDIKAAIWEVCGNAGALQLLVDLLTTKIMELEEGSGTEANDTALLEGSSAVDFPLKEQQDELSEHECNIFERKQPMTKNRYAAIVYRRGQKHLAHLFFKEAQDAFQLCLSEE